MRAEAVTAVVSEHGEGPVWSEDRGALLLVDLSAGDLLELPPSGAVERRHVDHVLAALRPRADGGLVAAVERGFRLLDAELRPDGVEIPAFDEVSIRMNDGGCDPQGRFYCGTMAYDEQEGAGSLYRLDPEDGSVSTVLTGVTISNGIQWSADGRTVYYIDTPTRRIDLFDFDPVDGSFHDRRPFVELGEDDGHPDGMAIDADGGLWVACWGGSSVRRYDADGAPSEVIEVPVPNPTACAFGGADGSMLYITSSRQGGGDRVAASGSVFAVETGVRGAPLHRFAG